MTADWPEGLVWHREWLDRAQQIELLAEIRELLQRAPLYRPTMPKSGKPLSVRMSNAGPLGWITDRAGYRYEACHPMTGKPWPAIPERLLEIWQQLAGYPEPPEACLINLYDAEARMGQHRDRDEAALDAPVLSVSLGDTALFRIGGTRRSDPSLSVRLSSGDLLLLGGASRHCYHGVDRILFGSSRLLAGGGRLNLTLRRVTPPRS